MVLSSLDITSMKICKFMNQIESTENYYPSSTQDNYEKLNLIMCNLIMNYNEETENFIGITYQSF